MAVQHFDISLNSRFGFRGSCPINPFFVEWQDYVYRHLLNRNGDAFYSSVEDKSLLELCHKHASLYNKDLSTSNLLVLTHPFYLHLSHMHYLYNNTREQAESYINTLVSLFTNNFPHNKLGIVVLDPIHYYAALSSSLLEDGKIDRIIFTKYDEGKVLDSNDLEFFRGKDLFFGGGYYGHCLSTSIRDVHELGIARSIHAVTDLVVSSPQHSLSIKPRAVLGVKGKDMTWDEVMQMILDNT